MAINWIRMTETRGQADGGRSSATARRPVATPSSRWEMNLGDEEMTSPNRQVDNAPPEDRVPREERGGGTRQIPREGSLGFSGYEIGRHGVDRTRAARAADVATWEEVMDLPAEK